MKVSNNWFDRGPRQTWEEHLLLLRGKIGTYLEIGICEGQSMKWILENLGPTEVVGIDPWKAPRRQSQEAYDQYKLNFYDNLANHLDDPSLRITILEMTSWDAFAVASLPPLDRRYARQPIPNLHFDLAYVDGAHLGNQALEDMVHVWRKLKPGREGGKKKLGGGIMIVDDIHRRYHGGRSLVKPAVMAFRLAYDGLFTVMYETPRQIAFLKHKD